MTYKHNVDEVKPGDVWLMRWITGDIHEDTLVAKIAHDKHPLFLSGTNDKGGNALPNLRGKKCPRVWSGIQEYIDKGHLELYPVIARSYGALDVIQRISRAIDGRLPVYQVILAGYLREDKVKLIKTIRTITGLGLKEAKDLTDTLPSVIVETSLRTDAETACQELDKLGTVSVRIEEIT